MSAMLDAMKDLFEKEQKAAEEAAYVEPEIVINEETLINALDSAIHALTEIRIYGSYNRGSDCEREANEALAAIQPIKDRYDADKVSKMTEESNDHHIYITTY